MNIIIQNEYVKMVNQVKWIFSSFVHLYLCKCSIQPKHLQAVASCPLFYSSPRFL